MSAILIVLLIVVYFIPTFVADRRKNHVGAIFALNLFLGWTLLGWVGALVLALWNNNAAPTAAT
jgi:sorbitol-specific phosphotransferase system component IIC